MKAQPCVPGTITSTAAGYILPDSTTNMNHGCPGQPYLQIMYLKAPPDTAFVVTTPLSGTITAHIDSFVVEKTIAGLPTYLSVSSVPGTLPAAGSAFPKSNMERMVIPGDSLACVRIDGNVPSSTTPGTNTLTIKLRAYLSNLSSSNAVLNALIPTLYPGNKTDTIISLGYYKIVIDAVPCPTAVSNLTRYGFDLIGNIPNPFSNDTRINFEANKATNLDLKIMNAMGQVIYTRSIKSDIGMNYITLDASNWSKGVYSYSLSDGQNRVTRKMELR